MKIIGINVSNSLTLKHALLDDETVRPLDED